MHRHQDAQAAPSSVGSAIHRPAFFFMWVFGRKKHSTKSKTHLNLKMLLARMHDFNTTKTVNYLICGLLAQKRWDIKN